MVKPITPKEAALEVQKSIPDFVISSFNDKIIEAIKNKSGIIDQKELVDLIVEKSECRCNDQDVFDNGWLNVEELFADAGWILKYVKPEYYDVNSKKHFTVEPKEY